ncbi:TM2 domain-containing protein [Succinimonas amylolytica]|uniref:TM2 domain-containing protein n=1 Tax=Succinimonas amylolytica TaxID=83769 RepID=UPI00036B2140|nr:TM2 domain-containing protein [Succinimonas amylolytica]
MNDNIIKANGTPVIGPHTVNKVIYLVLAFFLGGFGIHKFYARRPLAGIICVLFCWTCIPLIWSLISFVIALFTPSDSLGNIEA